MQTWAELELRFSQCGVTAELVVDVIAMVRSPNTVYYKWRTATQDRYQREGQACVTVLAAIKQRLEGHEDHDGRRHWIAQRDVVVTGSTDENGVAVPCVDPICCAWNTRHGTAE